MVARLTIEDSWRIAFLRQDLKLSLRQIARRLHCSTNTVCQVLQSYPGTGDVKDLPCSGRSSVMSDNMLATLERAILSNPRLTTRELTVRLERRTHRRVSLRNIQRARRECLGFHAVHERIQQVLTPSQMVARVSFAETHLNNSWHYVLFIDEKLFQLKVAGNAVWIHPGH